MLDYITAKPWLAAIIIFISQLAFIYFRTLNVIYTSERRMIPAILTGNGIGVAWLISTAVGLNSLTTGDWQPILAFLIGGTLGTYWGIKQEKYKKNGK